MTRNSLVWLALTALGCAGGGSNDTGGGPGSSGNATTGVTPTGDAPTTGSTPTDGSATAASGTSETTEGVSSEPTTGTGTTGDDTTASSSGGPGCGPCDEPNQQCVAGECVTSCQGQDPDPCGPAQVCDVISGTCKDPGETCSLTGPETACGAGTCGPGTVCDGVDTCLAIAPCASVVCTSEGHCWGDDCACERAKACADPALDLINGPFSQDVGGIDFADDCTAWMVTLRSGTDYLRRLTPDGELSEWAGVANLNMGEVKVLRSLTIPQLTASFPVTLDPTPPSPKEGLGEVAISYTCCPTCGCQADPPQGVARLVEGDPNNPLPIVIIAQQTQGNGPFGSSGADAGPHGLTWGVDRVLYVG